MEPEQSEACRERDLQGALAEGDWPPDAPHNEEGRGGDRSNQPQWAWEGGDIVLGQGDSGCR